MGLFLLLACLGFFVGVLLRRSLPSARFVVATPFAKTARRIIPSIKGRPTQKKLRSRERENMRAHWDIYKLFYGQRWQVETVNSMIKRNLTHALSAVGYHAQGRQTRLLAITHNIMI